MPFLLVLAVALIDLACMPGLIMWGDPEAWRREAASILLRGELEVPQPLVGGLRGQWFTQHVETGAWYSKYGVMNALMTLPPMWVQSVSGGADWALASGPWLLVYNLWNIALSALLAALLYRAAAAYTPRLALRALFVIAVMYCTFLWFYQRAQNSEIYQVVFFTALFLCLRECRRTQAFRWALAAWLFTLALVLTRVVYGLLIPLVAPLLLYALCAGRDGREIRRLAPKLGAALALPPVLIVALLGWINHVKFGAPWLTGYHQWEPAWHWPTGRWSDGLYGFLLAPRFSIFLYFPPLIFALFGLRRFARAYPFDTVAVYACFATFLIFLAKLPAWAGEWTYGPRFLLFVLPLASLPALAFAESLIEKRSTWPARAAAVLAFAALGYSAYLQIQVNRLPYYTYYIARPPEDVSPVAKAYFRNHVGVISDDLLRHRDELERLAYWEDFQRIGAPESVAAYKTRLSETLAQVNWFWSRPRGPALPGAENFPGR
jgi:hypothetical protein